MSIDAIIKAVRWCIDEEAATNATGDNGTFDGTFDDSFQAASFYDTLVSDNILMNNIIKSKIGDALRWICIYAPAELLTGNDGSDTTGILVDVNNATTTAITTGGQTIGGYIQVPNEFIKIVRVRGNGWHRAVKELISEDSEEYLQLYDENGAKATADRPQAAIIERAQKRIEVYPNGNVDYTYVKDVTVGQDYTASATPLVPDKAKTSFIYYLAFLLLSAYGDERAVRMLEIAKMNLGKGVT